MTPQRTQFWLAFADELEKIANAPKAPKVNVVQRGLRSASKQNMQVPAVPRVVGTPAAVLPVPAPVTTSLPSPHIRGTLGGGVSPNIGAGQTTMPAPPSMGVNLPMNIS